MWPDPACLRCTRRTRWALLCCALLSASCASQDDAPAAAPDGAAEEALDERDREPPRPPKLPPEAYEIDGEDAVAAFCSVNGAESEVCAAISRGEAPSNRIVLTSSNFSAGGASVHDRLVAAGFGDPEKAPTQIGDTELWKGGGFVDMSSHRVVALNNKSVVLCFGLGETGGCRFAGVNSRWMPEAIQDGGRERKLFPSLPWGPTLDFYSEGIRQVEVERLGALRFVVCYEHTNTSGIACSIGSVDDGGAFLLPFGPPLELGHGRLISVSVSMRVVRRFAVCYQDPPQASGTVNATSNRTEEETLFATQTRCRWAEVVGDAASGNNLASKWIDAEPVIVVARQM